MINRKFEEIDPKYINPLYNNEQFLAQEEEYKEELFTEASNAQKPSENVEEFLHYRKADRLDKYIYLKLLEIISIEIKKSKHFKMMLEDLHPRNEQFENKAFSRRNYLLYLYSCLVAAETFCKEKDSIKICEQLRKVFELVIYPRNNYNKLQGEK